ncbi:MAG: hypothetical protein AAB469_00830 [Patescibacteria group bacterium]
MKFRYEKYITIGLLSFSVVFIFLGFVFAQEIDKERAIDIVQTQGGPGGCTDEESCRAFCENPDNFETCVNWARENGLVSEDHAEKTRKLARQAKNFSGPGGCSTPEECKAFCDQPQNHSTCIDFAVSQGFMTQEEADRIKQFRHEAEKFREESGREREEFKPEVEVDPEFDKEKAKLIIESEGGPGGCSSMEQCEQFCEQEQNHQTCFEFAEKYELFKNKGHFQKIKKILKEGGPGGCKGEKECKAYCENPDNFEVCLEFAQKNEFIKPEHVEKARRGIKALKEGGPNGCKTPKECEDVCHKPENQEACFEWAKKHGLMSEEEMKKVEEFKKRGEEMRREFEQRGEEFKRKQEHRSQEFEPPGKFLGPGGCVGAEECRKYCENPDHSEECGGFKTPSNIQPPGFGGTPPAEHQPEFTSPPENIPQNLDNYIESHKPEYSPAPEHFPAPEYSPMPEFSPTPEPHSYLNKTSAYILKSFRDFFK